MAKVVIFKILRNPMIGLEMGKSKDGRIWRKYPTSNYHHRSGWNVYNPDLISLALQGQTEEIKMFQKLMRCKVPKR